MKKSHFVGTFLLLIGLVSWAFAQEHDVHWDYDGEEGPEYWGELNEEWALCSTGQAQTPIDITMSDFSEGEFPAVEFNYQPSAVKIINNGHTIQFAYDAGSTLTLNGTIYNLLQFHFHLPSEHRIDGDRTAMELHLVHQNESGALAVLGIFIEPKGFGETFFDDFWDQLPREEGEVDLEGTINAADFLPEAYTLLTYTGSLTTPPCSEGVTWLLLDTPMHLTTTQIAAFGEIFPMNARPVQPLNERELILNN